MNSLTAFHQIQTNELQLTIGDNTEYSTHQAGYNGIWSLTSIHDATSFFLPDYCGMNFEFIVPMSAEDPMEPRFHPTRLRIDSPNKQVTLHQSPTPVHHVESWMTYRIAGPTHIDWTFRYRLHNLIAFPTGMAGFFVANYILKPENKSIYVLSRDVYDALMWIQFCTTFQGCNSAVTWEEDAYKVHFGDRDHGLYTSQAPIRFAVPVFLGRRNDMAFVVMFEKPQGVVICHGMGGGGYVEDLSDRHPAWDFFLYTDNAADHPEGEWNGRLVYKKFVSRDDILDEYAAFMKSRSCYWIVPKYGPTSR